MLPSTSPLVAHNANIPTMYLAASTKEEICLSVTWLLLSPLQVDVEKKKSFVRILVDIGCTGLCKAAFARVSKSSCKFCCPLCCLGTQEKDIKVL